MKIHHKPVLVDEVIEFLKPYQDGVIVDATAGEGGHSEAILQRINPKLLVVMDRDMEILQVARERIGSLPNVRFVYGNFANIKHHLEAEGIKTVSAVLMDLGVSSFHLEDPERGFSFMHEGPLDMRFDRVSERKTAEEIVNEASEKQLTEIIKEYGEEPWARRIARFIVEKRKEKRIKTTKQLADIVAEAIPKRFWPKKIHPATKTFQALRIAVNRELDFLKEGLKEILDVLEPGGRIVVISFHSLEDRIVKHSFKSFEKKGFGTVITKKPIVPTEEEIEQNQRARSAKLRVFEKA